MGLPTEQEIIMGLTADRSCLKKNILYLEAQNKRYKEALEFYADEKEWHKNKEGSRWKLLFNSSDKDGHGFEIAQAALKDK
jgi:hypothetical protein